MRGWRKAAERGHCSGVLFGLEHRVLNDEVACVAVTAQVGVVRVEAVCVFLVSVVDSAVERNEGVTLLSAKLGLALVENLAVKGTGPRLDRIFQRKRGQMVLQGNLLSAASFVELRSLQVLSVRTGEVEPAARV